MGVDKETGRGMFTQEWMGKVNPQRKRLHSCTEESSLLPLWQVELEDEEYCKDTLVRLSNMVRSCYLTYLRRVLTKNSEICSEKDSLGHTFTSNDIDKCAAQMELKALRACMVSSLYQRAMAQMTSNVKQDTKEFRLYKKLVELIQLRCNCPNQESKETQTDPVTLKCDAAVQGGEVSPDVNIAVEEEPDPAVSLPIPVFVSASAVPVARPNYGYLDNPEVCDITPNTLDGSQWLSEPNGIYSNALTSRLHTKRTGIPNKLYAKQNGIPEAFHAKQNDLSYTLHEKQSDLPCTLHTKHNGLPEALHAKQIAMSHALYAKQIDSENKLPCTRSEVQKKSCTKENDLPNKLHPEERRRELKGFFKQQEQQQYDSIVRNLCKPSDALNSQPYIWSLIDGFKIKKCEYELTSKIDDVAGIHSHRLVSVTDHSKRTSPGTEFEDEDDDGGVKRPKLEIKKEVLSDNEAESSLVDDSATQDLLRILESDGEVEDDTVSQSKCSESAAAISPPGKCQQSDCIGLERTNTQDSEPSIWTIEKYIQQKILHDKISKMCCNPEKKQKMKDQFFDLFGFDWDSEDIWCSEEQIVKYKERIAPWIVKYLMPYYKQKRMVSRPVFKYVARHIADELVAKNHMPDENDVEEGVTLFFSYHGIIEEESDVWVGWSTPCKIKL